MHPIHVDPSLTGPRWLAHLGEAQDFTVLHTIPQPAEDRRAMVSVLRGRGSAERLRYSPLQTLVTWEVSAGLAEGDPGEGAGHSPSTTYFLHRSQLYMLSPAAEERRPEVSRHRKWGQKGQI